MSKHTPDSDPKQQRKPHSICAGYVSERKCKASCGGYIVIYDRHKGFDCDADERWIVQHEPSGNHVAVKSLKDAYEVMRDGELFPVETFGVDMNDLAGGAE